MVVSEIFYRPIYQLFWHASKALSATLPLAFYAPEEIDFIGFRSVAKHLPPLCYITQNKDVKAAVQKHGLKTKPLFSFPEVLITSRHAMHRFPTSKIVSIGMRHGPYHFKRMTRAANYNRFDLYLFSSQADLAAAEENGVKVGKAIGFPALDAAFDGSITSDDLQALSAKYQLHPDKPSLLFTATWDKVNMSAIDRWLPHLLHLADRYNLMVTLHPWVSPAYWQALAAMPCVRMVAPLDLIKSVILADVCIGDQSSVLAYCSALDKPMITFALPPAARSLPEIDDLIKSFSISIESYHDLEAAIQDCLKSPAELHQARMDANTLMFDALDGQAGLRAANAIKELLNSRGIKC